MHLEYRSALLVVVALVGQSPAAEPTAAQVDWIKNNAIPFKTVKAERGFEDLAPLKELIGDARIVSLGESKTAEAAHSEHSFVPRATCSGGRQL